MARVEFCDICKQPTERIVAKLFYAPRIPGVSSMNHSDYTQSLDVGICCDKKLLKSFRFRKRLTTVQYNEKRKAASG